MLTALAFVAGLMVGGPVGCVVMALLITGSRADAHLRYTDNQEG